MKTLNYIPDCTNHHNMQKDYFARLVKGIQKMDFQTACSVPGKKLVTNAFIDKVLFDTRDWVNLKPVFPIWPLTILAYPKKDEPFKESITYLDSNNREKYIIQTKEFGGGTKVRAPTGTIQHSRG